MHHPPMRRRVLARVDRYLQLFVRTPPSLTAYHDLDISNEINTAANPTRPISKFLDMSLNLSHDSH